jgi:monoamine oxidase
MKRDTHVIVVGAGISGLSCAREIAVHGLRVTVLEANDRVGGRMQGDADGTDFGAAYIGPTQLHLLRAVERYGLELFPTRMEGKTCQFLRGRVQHYAGLIPPVSLLGQLELNAAIVRLEELADAIDPSYPERHRDAAVLDSTSFAEFTRSVCPYSADARSIMATSVRAILCVEPCEVSLLTVAWYLACNGGPLRTFETRNGLQDAKIRGGTSKILQCLSDDITRHGGAVILGCPVDFVDCSEAHAVRVGTRDGDVYHCDHVAICVPPTVRASLSITPAVSLRTHEALKRWRPGHVVKTFLFYPTQFWRDRKLNGIMVCGEGYAMVTYDDTKHDGTLPCIMGFVMGKECAASYDDTPAQRLDRLRRHYAEVLQDERALEPTRYKEKVWVEEPYIGGGYVGVPTMGTFTQYPRGLITASHDSRIVYGGTECAVTSVGYMDGGVQAGERAACAILKATVAISTGDEVVLLNPMPSRLLPLRPFRTSFVERYMVPSSRTVVRIAYAVSCAVAYVSLCALCTKFGALSLTIATQDL